jgi:tripartite-type tricarboxylate transporter receptor subunit TctC
MNLFRRQFLHLAAGAIALPTATRIAAAQTYPTRPVHLIVGFPAGGIVDLFARLMGQRLTEQLGQPFIIENRTGAASNIATEVVVKSPPDGYTLLMINTVNAINATLYEKLNFNFMADIAPVASLYRNAPGVMVVNPSFPAKTVPEFITYAKANPGKINMASSGSGSSPHLYGELFKMMAGVDLLHVPYRGQPQALSDLIGGQVQVTFDLLANSIGYIKADRLMPLAVTTARRSPVLPSIPTVGEFIPGYEASGWQGIGAPKNTPSEIIEMLNKAINEGLADPKVKARFADLGGYTTFESPPADFGQFIAEDTQKWAKVIRAANIKAE